MDRSSWKIGGIVLAHRMTRDRHWLIGGGNILSPPIFNEKVKADRRGRKGRARGIWRGETSTRVASTSHWFLVFGLFHRGPRSTRKRVLIVRWKWNLGEQRVETEAAELLCGEGETDSHRIRLDVRQFIVGWGRSIAVSPFACFHGESDTVFPQHEGWIKLLTRCFSFWAEIGRLAFLVELTKWLKGFVDFISCLGRCWYTLVFWTVGDYWWVWIFLKKNLILFEFHL